MPLGLRFLPTPKKVKKVISGEKVKNDGGGGGIELKSLSDPLLNVSCKSASVDDGDDGGRATPVPAPVVSKSESVHTLPDLMSSGACPGDEPQPGPPLLDAMSLEGSGGQAEACPGPEGETNPLEIPEMVGSFFDKNGNEVEEEEEPLTAAAPIAPKCFINAAALLDEEPEYVPSPPPSLLLTAMESTPPRTKSPLASRKAEVSPSSSGIPIRRRVPISKSFPDIIQTTILKREEDEERFHEFTGKGRHNEMRIPNHQMGDSLIVADSLEEISAGPPGEAAHRDSIDVLGPINPKVFERIDAMMTDSILNAGGIFNEKPPETWIVDFNSFTSDPEEEQRHRERRKSTSSTNSLAYFISMDEVDSETESTTRKEELTSSTDSSSKKIFSMFVDIGKESQSPSSKSSRMEPSPTHQAGVGSRRDGDLRLKALHSGIPKYPHPHFPSSSRGQEFKVSGGGGGGSMSSSMMMSSVSDTGRSQFQGISNRSSLHVANHEHDGSFTSSILSSMEMSALEGTYAMSYDECDS